MASPRHLFALAAIFAACLLLSPPPLAATRVHKRHLHRPRCPRRHPPVAHLPKPRHPQVAATVQLPKPQNPAANVQPASIPAPPSDLIVKLCKSPRVDPKLREPCVQALASDPRTASAKTQVELAKGAIALAVEKANQVAKLLGSPGRQTPSLKSCGKYCQSVVVMLNKSAQFLEMDPQEAGMMTSGARDSTTWCKNVLEQDNLQGSPIGVANEDLNRAVKIAMVIATPDM